MQMAYKKTEAGLQVPVLTMFSKLLYSAFQGKQDASTGFEIHTKTIP